MLVSECHYFTFRGSQLHDADSGFAFKSPSLFKTAESIDKERQDALLRKTISMFAPSKPRVSFLNPIHAQIRK